MLEDESVENDSVDDGVRSANAGITMGRCLGLDMMLSRVERVNSDDNLKMVTVFTK